MPEVKFTHIISCSSEDKQYPAENLLRPQSYKKWKCKPGDAQASVILQLEKAIQLQSLDVGNEGSAFVEILGGRSSATNGDYKVILPTAGFMTPDESRKESNLNGVRFFDAEKFTDEGRSEKWDRLKINCTQPFNKNLAFGLSFVKAHAVASDEDKTTTKTFGKFKLKDDVDESGISKAYSSDLAPGALFLSRRKEKVDETPSLPATKVTTESGGAGKRESFWSAPSSSKRKPVEKNGDADHDKAQETKRRKQTPEAKKPISPAESKKNENNSTSKQSSTKTEAFDSLFDGVIFVLSGFQNPLRSELRDRAIEMGAKYRADWGPDCTHLICAFANTPKYNQVRGKGKIVKKEWILDSHKKRKQLGWKKYAFEATSDGSSDEELVGETSARRPVANQKDQAKESTSGKTKGTNATQRSAEQRHTDREKSSISTKSKASPASDPYNASTDYSDLSSGGDTDDEIQRVRANKRKAADRGSASTPPSTKPKRQSPKKLSDGPKDKSILPLLPDFFSGKRFFLYGGFPESERKQLNRYIVAFDGVVEQYMGKKVTHVLTNEKWDDSFDDALKDFPDIIFLKPGFVLACGRNEKMVDMDQYIMRKG